MASLVLRQILHTQRSSRTLRIKNEKSVGNKHEKYLTSARIITLIDCFIKNLLIVLFLICWINLAYAQKPGTSGNSGATYVPMSLEYEDYTFQPSYDESCLGEDDALSWQATGSLAPGESFSYTPKVAGCKSHPAVIAAVLSWEGGKLELSSTVPDKDFTNRDPEQKGKHIIAPNVGNSAQLCMFPFYSQQEEYYTIKITNTGADIASNIVLKGISNNDWPVFYYPSCINADADGDGWNDSFEHLMSTLVYYSDLGSTAPATLWGSNYLATNAKSFSIDDEIDAFPSDMNDDDLVDSADVTEISEYVGQGNGIPLESISPNSSPEYLYNNTKRWRRYDLDGDGYVSETDINIAASLVGQSIPMTEDIVSPTARVVFPSEVAAVPKGKWTLIRGHVWDNAALARVDYLLNGKTLCSYTNPIPTSGYTSPFYICGWQVPNRPGGGYDLSIRVIDAAGNEGLSPTVSVTTQ